MLQSAVLSVQLPANSLQYGLLAWWTLNEASGNRADSTGRGNTMVQTGSITGAAGFGNVGNVSVWSGSNSNFLSCGSLLTTSPWSIALWFNRSIGLTDRPLFTSIDGNDGINLQAFRVTNNGHIACSIDGGTEVVGGPDSVGIGSWGHAAFTYDGTTVIGYLNAVQQLSAAKVADYTDVDQTLLGTDADGTAYGGDMVAAGVWNRVLSTTEISSLYNGGNGVQYPFS